MSAMFKLTTNEAPFVHYQCGCSRLFIGDEMYLCVQCEKAMCRYCMQEEEIKEFTCRHCLDQVSTYDAANQNNYCMRHLQCPICFNVLTISLLNQRKKMVYYQYCVFCKWDANKFNYQAKDINNLLAKVQLFKGLYLKSPQQWSFARLVTVFKFNIEQAVKMEQNEVRVKRNREESLFIRKDTQVKGKFTKAEFELMMEQKRENAELEKRLLTFDELYDKMQDTLAIIDDSKSAVSHSEMISPRDFQSDISATPKGAGPMGLNIQTPKGAIDSGYSGLPNMPGSTTNASRAGGIDMGGDGVAPPQTPAGNKVPSLDMSKVAGMGMHQPQTTTNKGSGRLLLQSPSAANARNVLADRTANMVGKDNKDGVNKRDLPNEEFKDFLQSYDETMWQHPEDEEQEKTVTEGKNALKNAITDEIKEEEQEGSDASDEEDDKPDSPGADSMTGSQFNNTMINEGDEGDDTFMPLDEALGMEFDINKVSKLEQRLHDVNRQPRKRNELYPFRLQLLSKRVKKCKSCHKKIVAPGDQSRGQMLMNSIIPKVTIYRIGKLEPGNEFVDLLLMVRNPNNSRAKVSFSPLTAEQMLGQHDKVIIDIEMPAQHINVDPQEIYQDAASVAQSAADSAATQIKALVASCEADQRFIYKKNDNAVILILKMKLPQGFQPEKQELCFGFQMHTDSLRFSTDPFKMTTPVVVNCGKASIKGADDARSQSTAQASQRSVAVSQSMTSQRSAAVNQSMTSQRSAAVRQSTESSSSQAQQQENSARKLAAQRAPTTQAEMQKMQEARASARQAEQQRKTASSQQQLQATRTTANPLMAARGQPTTTAQASAAASRQQPPKESEGGPKQ